MFSYVSFGISESLKYVLCDGLYIGGDFIILLSKPFNSFNNKLFSEFKFDISDFILLLSLC
jgi:hypothetical protein